jgi:transposase
MLDTFSMVKEISVMEQRYQAVLAVIADGRGVGEVAAQFGVSRRSVHSWLRRYEDHGLEGLANWSHKPKSIPHQMPASVEAAVLELRREHRTWGPRRLVYELLKRGVVPVTCDGVAMCFNITRKVHCTTEPAPRISTRPENF